jgi:phosphoribosylformylglycinamidine (FGAM) synthase-like enzyme
VVPPGEADAAVLRIKGTDRAIATAIDCNSRYCYLDPELGGRHAVAEATRNVSCVGATPLAITNCLNFGSPEKPAGYYQLDRAVAGMAAACVALGVPVVSGNVSLYNETAAAPVMPTPTVGAVGVIEHTARHATMHCRPGDIVLLVGDRAPTIGASEYLSACHGMTAGHPPELDLTLELRVQNFVRSVISEGILRTAHDCSEGGLAVALAEMAIVSGIGLAVLSSPPGANGRVDEAWFGEAPSRIVIACDAAVVPDVERRAKTLDVSITCLGTVGGNEITLGEAAPVPLVAARTRYESALVNLS